MPGGEVADLLPQEGAQVLSFDEQHRRIESGRYVHGRWYVKNPADGPLTVIACVTHWAPIFRLLPRRRRRG
jgi:hypothetical protein